MKFAQAVKDTWKQYKFVWNQVTGRGVVIQPLKETLKQILKLLDQSLKIVVVVLCIPLFPVGVVVRMYEGWKKK